ncbi:MAG: hypothetical protein U0L05_05250 [Schaedlerella sp.]|nr:hypothetical protein [Schaedlerella sp.]
MRKLESIYKTMNWYEADYVKMTTLTSQSNKDSRTFCLAPKESTLDALKRVFCIDTNDFDEKYKQACSGSGQEERRIATLHSSSLCALLFFYNLSEENPLTIYVDGLGDVSFIDAIFEYQNCVIENANPSNMDVTLLGKCNGKKVILFLESKFSEYITGTQKKLNINQAYLSEEISKNIYEKWQWDINLMENEKEFSISISDMDAYLGGLKQMISHYVGVRKFERGICKLKNGMSSDKDLYSVANNPKKQAEQERLRNYALGEEVVIVLGSILFDIYEDDGQHQELQKYEELYVKLMRQLSEDVARCKSDIVVLENFYTYQDLFKDKKQRTTREIYKFYFGE